MIWLFAYGMKIPEYNEHFNNTVDTHGLVL